MNNSGAWIRLRLEARAAVTTVLSVVAAALLAAGVAPAAAQQAGGASPAMTGSQTAPAATTTATAPGGVAKPADYDQRLKKLSEELRCLVCQNQTLADSNADLAVDLRRQVEEQISQGKSDSEIKSYLVERYGDFVLYRPPVQGNTFLLWFGPFALLLVGGVVWLVVQRRSGQAAARTVAAAPTAAPAAPAQSDAERERARKLLGG
jgi:cytochrome c-type biogenesis protein CcmH